MIVADPAARTLIVRPSLCTSATRLSELVKLISRPELATAVGMKAKSPTDLSAMVPKEIVWSDLLKVAVRVLDGA